MPPGACARALTAQRGFVAKRDVEHAALATVHRIKAEGLARILYLFGDGSGAQAKLFDAQRAVIVGVEGNARMIVGMQAQHLLRDELESEEQLGAIAEEQIDVFAGEFYRDVRTFKVGVGVVAGFDGEVELRSLSRL